MVATTKGETVRSPSKCTNVLNTSMGFAPRLGGTAEDSDGLERVRIRFRYGWTRSGRLSWLSNAQFVKTQKR